jgi:hypothetical protein
MRFNAKTWNNGKRHSSGAGYGIKITMQNREQFFNRSWSTVILHLNGYSRHIEANVDKLSFWKTDCGELIKKDIGIWLLQNNCAVGTLGWPFEVRMTIIGEREFKVELI